MKIFKINKNARFECDISKRGNTETAELYIKNEFISKGRYTWINRPWQSYTYSIALSRAFKKARLSPYYKKLVKKFIASPARTEDDSELLKTVAMVVSLGNIFANTQKEKNDWKARMLKAGLENKGLVMPDNWESLSENEKTRRLDGVINQLSK